MEKFTPKWVEHYKGSPVDVETFFNELYQDEEFTSELGKVILNTSKLEAEIVLFLRNKGCHVNPKTSLNELIKRLENSGLYNEYPSYFIYLKEQKNHRNFFTHNIYASLLGLTDLPILDRDYLELSDTKTLTDYVFTLNQNLSGFIDDLIERKTPL